MRGTTFIKMETLREGRGGFRSKWQWDMATVSCQANQILSLICLLVLPTDKNENSAVCCTKLLLFLFSLMKYHNSSAVWRWATDWMIGGSSPGWG
jgi:hypothetical protein